MDAISLHQPWASWVAMGLKKIETRRHDRFKNLVGKRIAIHAAKKFDKRALEISERFRRSTKVYPTASLPSGVIVCTAFVLWTGPLYPYDSYRALCDCGGNDFFGLCLGAIKPLKTPLPWKGQQGIFQVPDEPINY